MKISFEQKGGIIGATLRSSVDISYLSSTDAQIIKDAITDSDFFNLSPESLPERGADYFIYTITVDSGGKNHRIVTSDNTAPKALKPLIRLMRKKTL